MDRIRIVSAVYPRPWRPESGRFTANLAEGWTAHGVAVDVVTSSTLSERIKARRRKPVNVDMPNVEVNIVRTLGTPFGSRLPEAVRRSIRGRDTRAMNAAMSQGPRPDLFYAQFAGAGRYARTAAQEEGLPYVIDLGESKSLVKGATTTVEETRLVLKEADGVVCKSPRLQKEAIELGADPAWVKLIPNYPNRDRFYPRDRADCRQALGLDEDSFLVVYLGHFCRRKGAQRLNEALKRMKHPVKAAFLGSGDLEPDFDGVVHAGIVAHDVLPLWLNAADVMGLPTLAEGCCNAISEALACGLPLVTSNIEDVRWQVPESGVLLVDPTDPERIAAALDRLAGDTDLLKQLRTVVAANIERDAGKVRSDEILSFLEQVVAHHSSRHRRP